MGTGEQIQMGEEAEEEVAEQPPSPAPPHRFMCRDCQDGGKSPLEVAVQYRAKVEHVLEFCEDTGAYRLVRTAGELDDDVELYCCACGFDVPATAAEEDAIAKSAGVMNLAGRVSVRCDHRSGGTEIIF